MEKEITIILPIELKKREFDSRLLLAYHLVNKGYKVIIGDRAGCERESKNIQNCIYIAKSLAFSQKSMYDNFHANNGKVLILYEEGAYVGRLENVASEIESAYPLGMLPYIDGILVYGESFVQVLTNHVSSLNSSNVIPIGNPRFDLHKPHYHSYFEKEVEDIKNRIGDYILFNGNFVRGNHHLGQEHLRNEIEQNEELTKEAKAVFYNFMDESVIQLDSFIKMIANVAKSIPEISIVVRPHPGEDLKIYYENLSKYKNVHITNKGMAYSWIIGAEIVVHQDCTTAVESIFANKPIISYIPFEDRSSLFWLSTFVSDIVSTENDIIIKIKKYLKGEKYYLSLEQKKIFNKEVINYSAFSHDLLIEVLESVILDMDLCKREKVDFKKRAKLIYQRFRSFLRWKKGKYYLKSRYVTAFEGVKKKEVLERLKKLNKMENGEINQIKVSNCGINVFLLESKPK